MSDDIFFNKPTKSGGAIKGVKGGSTHFHEYTEGLGIGHIKDQKTGKIITTVNNFNEEVNKLLPDWMKE